MTRRLTEWSYAAASGGIDNSTTPVTLKAAEAGFNDPLPASGAIEMLTLTGVTGDVLVNAQGFVGL